MESFTWVIALGVWSTLLALGMAGGDPLAAGRPGREAWAVKVVFGVARWSKRRRGAVTSGQLHRDAGQALHGETLRRGALAPESG